MFCFANNLVQSDMERVARQVKSLGFLKGKTVLITGATGLLATYCTFFLHYLNVTAGYGIKIIALVRNREKALARFSGFENDPDFSILVQDITQPLCLPQACDYILHMAGSASAYAITHDPVGIVMANVLGTKNVLDYASRVPGCRVFFSSTREVYGKMPGNVTCIQEEMNGVLEQMQARSCYPESKKMAENLLAVYHKQYGCDFVNARIAHAYGPGMAFEKDGRVMADLLNDGLSGRDITLNSNGLMYRSFCYVSDCIAAVFLVLLNGTSGETYNIANETEEISIRELALLIADSVPEKHLKVTYREATEEEKQGYLKIERVRLATGKVEQLGWRPLVSLKEGIRQTLDVGKSKQ